MLLAALRLLGLWSSNPLALLGSLLVTICGLCLLLGSHRVLRWPLLIVFGFLAILVGTVMVLRPSTMCCVPSLKLSV